MTRRTTVTQQEQPFPAPATLVSRSVLAGVIVHAHQDLIDISGSAEQELLGAGHNLVRHPNMAAAAFAGPCCTP